MRAFLRFQLGLLAVLAFLLLELKKSKASAAAKTASTWTPAVVPTEGDDIEVVSPNVVKWNSALPKMRSVIVKSGATFETTIEIEVGAASAQSENIGVKHEGTVAGEATWKFNGSFTTTAQTVLLPTTLKSTVSFGGGKWKLTGPLTTTKALTVSGATLEGNAQTIEVASIEVAEGTIDLSGCTAKASATAGMEFALAATVTTSSSTVLEVNGATGSFAGGSHTFNGTVKWVGREVKVTGESKTEKLEVLNKGVAAKGVQVGETTITFSSLLNFNGTEAERARIESKTAGKAWKLKGPSEYEPANSFVAIKDCTYEGGTLYLPNGKDETGNTNIVFGPKPGGGVTGKASGTILLTGTSKATVSNVVSGKATGPLLLTGTSVGIVRNVVTGKGTGALLLTGSSNATLRAVVLGKATGELLLTGSSNATVRSVVSAQATGTLLFTGRAKAISTATGKKVFLLVIDE